MKRITVLLCILAAASSVFGASISGYLTDSESGESLPYANVYIEGKPLGSTTNDKGFYIIEGVPQGENKLVVTYLGYEEFGQNVSVSHGERLRLDIELIPSAEVGAEIVVEARREGGEKDLTVGHLIVSQDNMLQVPHFLEADLFRTMHLLPGVVSPSDFSSALYIWGGLPSHNLVTLDGIEVYSPSHLGGLFSAFVIDAIKEANLIKGGFPAKWGGRIGSVLEIINREGNRKKVHGSAEISLISSHATLHGPLPKFTGPGAWLISARRTYIDWATKLIVKDNYLPYHFTDIHTKLTRDFESGDKFSLTYYYGTDEFDFEDDFLWEWGNNTFSANLTHLFSPKHFGHFTAAYSQFKNKLSFEWDDPSSGELFRDYVKDFTVRGMLSTAYPRHTLEFGLECKYMSILNHIEDPAFTEPIWDWENSAAIISIYGQDEWNLSPLWRLELGLRNEMCTSGSYFRISPRASLMRILDTKTRIKFAAGQYYQYFQSVPKFTELGLDIFNTWVLSQEGLEPSWATHFVLRGETEHVWDLPITLDIYYKKMGNLWRHKETFTPNDYFPDLFEKGEGWASGADLLVRFNGTKWAGWLGYSFSYAVQSFPTIDNGEPFYAKYDRRHDVSINLARDIGRGWLFSAAWLYNPGKPYTEPVGLYRPIDTEAPTAWAGEDELFFGGYNNKRVPTYHRLDIGLSHRSVFSWGDLEFYMQVLNIYGRDNVNTFYYSGFGEKDTIPELFFPMPSFGLRVWF